MGGPELLVINGCKIRKDMLYSYENHLWFEPLSNSHYRIGLLPTTQHHFGKIRYLRLKDPGIVIESGKPLMMLEARRFMGHVHSPLTVRIHGRNDQLSEEPHVAQEDPFGRGWVYEVEVLDEFHGVLEGWESVAKKVAEDAEKKGLICFEHVPDYVYAAIGIECSQVVMVLSDRLRDIPSGGILHVIAEYDPGSEEQLKAWAELTGNVLLDFRKEKKLAHALIRKA